MKYIAHRGFSSKAPENSIPAFELAALSNTHFGIECDVHQTKDDQFVVFHDDNLKRMTRKDVLLADLTYDELKLIPLKSGKNIRKYTNSTIPLLVNMLEICSKSNKTAVIELKRLNDISQLLNLMSLIEQFPGLSVVIISFNMNYLKFLRAISNVPLQLLTSTLNDEIIYDCRVNQLDFSLDKKIAIQKNIKRLKKEGFKISVWTVDDPKKAESLRKSGIDYITTDKL